MRILKTDVLCGLPAPTARAVMRALVTAAPSVSLTPWITGLRGLETLLALEAEGYIRRARERDGETWWVATVKGNALGGASFRQPISRSTAERLLDGVIDRARNYNSDPRHLLEISEVLVFGSYLDTSAERLGDLDIGATLRPRGQWDSSSEQFAELLLDYAAASGRRSGSFLDRLDWAYREAYSNLRGSSAAISVTRDDVRKLTERWDVVYLKQ